MTKDSFLRGGSLLRPMSRAVACGMFVGLLFGVSIADDAAPQRTAGQTSQPASRKDGPSKSPAAKKPAPAAKEPATDDKGAGEVTVRTVDAEQYAAIIARHKKQVVLVDFWATWCVPCRKQFPHTVALNHKYAPDGLATVSVSCDEEEKEAQVLTFLKKADARFENLRSKFGNDEQTYLAFDIEGGALPHYKLYDRTGKLRKTFGTDPDAEKQFTPEDIEAAVKELLAEK